MGRRKSVILARKRTKSESKIYLRSQYAGVFARAFQNSAIHLDHSNHVGIRSAKVFSAALKGTYCGAGGCVGGLVGAAHGLGVVTGNPFVGAAHGLGVVTGSRFVVRTCTTAGGGRGLGTGIWWVII